MTAPFEEPAKTEMRARCEIAIDQTGHELVETLVRIPLPTDSGLQGAIKGDLQSIDGEGTRYCYYVRPVNEDSLPKWLANLAAAAHELDGVQLYVVAHDPSPLFEKSCKVAGAGLVALNEDNEFNHILDFDNTLPEAVEEVYAGQLRKLRRDLETKLELNLDGLRTKFGQVNELTRGMAPDVAEKYAANIERMFRIWSDWGDEISVRLDAALTSRDMATLDAIAAAIGEGPTLDDDV